MESPPPEDRDPRRSRAVPPGLLAAAVLATVVVVVAVFVAVRSGPASTASAPTPDPGATTPVFTIRNGLVKSGTDPTGNPLPDISYTTFENDTPVSPARYRGKPLVVNFWSSNCTPCTTEMPDFQKVHQQFGDQVAFLGLDVQDGIDAGRFMLDKTGVKYDVGRDPNGDALLKVGGIGLPTTVLVGADGTVKRVHTGQLSADDLTASIHQELGV